MVWRHPNSKVRHKSPARAIIPISFKSVFLTKTLSSFSNFNRHQLWTKMEPLKTTKWLLTWLCMCPTNESSSLKMKFAYVGFTSTIFVINLLSMVSNMIFFMKFVSTDFKAALFAFMTLYGHFAMCYTLINAFRKQCKVNKLFEKLSEICRESK